MSLTSYTTSTALVVANILLDDTATIDFTVIDTPCVLFAVFVSSTAIKAALASSEDTSLMPFGTFSVCVTSKVNSFRTEAVGENVGVAVGMAVVVGPAEGTWLGTTEGVVEGCGEGTALGTTVGSAIGTAVG